MTRNALVTGGAQGLGEGICRRLARDGAWHVTVADINEELGSKVAKDIDGTFLKVDVTNPTQVKDAIARVVRERGSLDGVVANAGVVGELKPLGEYELDEWNRVIDVNLNGVFYTLKYALAQMEKQASGGNIVSLSSILGFRGGSGASPYTASKWAVRGLTSMAAVEYAQKKIRVNAIAPTVCDTPLVANMLERAPPQVKNSMDIFTDLNALPGVVQPSDIGEAAAFLLSDEARYITGHTLPVDAGALSRFANGPEKELVLHE